MVHKYGPHTETLTYKCRDIVVILQMPHKIYAYICLGNLPEINHLKETEVTTFRKSHH